MNHFDPVGTGVALITPFKNGSIDYEAYELIIDHVINGQAEYLVPLGSTGESATLSKEEQRAVLDHAIERNAGRKPIVAGNFGGNDTQAIIEKIKRYNFDGVDALLSSSPEYSKPSQEGIYQHFMSIASATDLPIIIYNVPGRTSSNIDWTTTIRLAEASKQFIAIKEASGDLVQAAKIIQNKPEHFRVISGDDETALPLNALGGSGVISVVGNAYPFAFSEMIRSVLKNNLEIAREWNAALYPLHKWLYLEGNPVGIKSAMKVLGLSDNEVRLPLSRMSVSSYNQLEQCMVEISNVLNRLNSL